MARVRPWDTPVAQFRAWSSLLGCTDTMVITIADAVQSNLEEVGGCHKLMWLLQRCRCVQPPSPTSPAALTSGSMVAGVHSLWLLLTVAVIDRGHDDSRRAPCGKPNAAVALLERPWHVALGHVGHVEHVSATVWSCLMRVYGGSTEPRHTMGITIVTFVVAVCKWRLCGGCQAIHMRPGSLRSGTTDPGRWRSRGRAPAT